MRFLLATVFFLLLPLFAGCESPVGEPGKGVNPFDIWYGTHITVDFPEKRRLPQNALGPQVVCADPSRSRIFVACANSSRIAIINGDYDNSLMTHQPWRHACYEVTTLYAHSRMPRRLRNPGMIVSAESGQFFLLGERQLIIVESSGRDLNVIDLPGDYEAIALDDENQRVILAGRTCPDLAIVDGKTEKVTTVACLEPAPQLPFMAASAPPPIRFPFVLPHKNRAYILDGCTASLVTVNLETLEKMDERKLPVEAVPRWHVAGFNKQREIVYAVLENKKREAKHAIAIDLTGENDVVVDLPEKHTEPAGIIGDPTRGEVYIPYDNKALVHVVTFDAEPTIETIDLPDLGVNATAYDPETRMLYAAGWKQAALYVLDMNERKRTLTVPFFPVYPHMNSMALDRFTNKLYIPTGSAAVNGTFGSAVSVFDTDTLEHSEVLTGWAPVCMARKPGSENYYVFSSNREYAEVTPSGKCTFHQLPHPYPRQAITDIKNRGVWVAYGPHSSWWPSYYINGTRNGIFFLNENGEVVKNRMTPKLVQNMIQDKDGQLWAMQNTWGKEEPFLLTYPLDASGKEGRWTDLRLPPKVDNECVLRLLAQDEKTGLIYAGKTGNLNTENGTLYAIDPKARTIIKEYETGRTPTSLCVASKRNRIYVTNFDDDTVTIIDTKTGDVKTKPTGSKPLVSAVNEKTGDVYVVNHKGASLTIFTQNGSRTIPLLKGFLPNNILIDSVTGYAFVTAIGEKGFRLFRVDAKTGKAVYVMRDMIFYSDFDFDHTNTAFQVRGQWGDGIFLVTEMSLDKKRRIWVTDYLSGKLRISDDAFEDTHVHFN